MLLSLSRPSLTHTTTPRTSTMTSPFWSCHPQYRWHPVCLLCVWPPPAPASPLEPNVSPLGGARPAKPVSEQPISESYTQGKFENRHKLTQVWTVQKKKYKGTAKYPPYLPKNDVKDLFVRLASSTFLLRSQQAPAFSSRLPCLCSALLSASSTGVITESLMPWSVLVLQECPPVR